MSFRATTLDGILQSYSDYLHKLYPANAKRFCQLSVSDREAAIAEAVVFGILQEFNVDPTIHDQPDSGGPDFICCTTARCHHDLPKIGSSSRRRN